MNQEIKSLKDLDLLSVTKNLAIKEREFTLLLLEHLQEIKRRRLFADLGYSSLFDYLRKNLGYSDAEAGIRVSAMKLLEEVPAAKAALTSGATSLTALGQTSASIRRQEKLIGEKLSHEEKENLLSQIARKSTRETEQILKEAEIENFKSKNITPPPSVMTTQKIVVSCQVVKKLEELKKIRGNYTDSEIIELLLDKELQTAVAATTIAAAPGGESSPTKKNSRYISVSVKKAIRERAQNRCEFVSSETGERCVEVHHLEYDHLRPFGFDGTNDYENLSLRCPAHNLRGAIKFYGQEKMDHYINPLCSPS